MSLATNSNPRVGMMAIVRGKRRAVISEVRPFLGDAETLHVVRLEYKDNQFPDSEELIWEREPFRKLLEPTALPSASDAPMPTEDFDAVLQASRWSALSPYLDPDSDGPLDRMPVCSPFHGAVQVEDYQLVPLLKALQMPRINLMIADDVGLGKTIEAGLILREMLIRRRIQRVLILTPASLRMQWRECHLHARNLLGPTAYQALLDELDGKPATVSKADQVYESTTSYQDTEDFTLSAQPAGKRKPKKG